MPGVFRIRGGSIARLVNHIYMIPEGIFGTCLGTSANYIVLFVIFGAFLEKSGLGSLIQDIAIELTGRYAGGPAKVAVFSSALFGTVSGIAAANVVTTGAFTIPLMKRIGYEPEFAAAVEACSSTSGQIVPPVMGTAALLKADYIGMPYKYIVLAEILPCILYYFSIFVAVHLRAKRKGLRGLEKSECPDVKKALKERGHLILPFVLVIYMICAGYSAVHSGFWGIVSTVAVAQLRKTTRMSFRDIIDALISGAKRSISVAVACACVGFIVGIVSLTGVGNVLGNYILILAGGKLLPTCFLAMLLSILLGMGLHWCVHCDGHHCGACSGKAERTHCGYPPVLLLLRHHGVHHAASGHCGLCRRRHCSVQSGKGGMDSRSRAQRNCQPPTLPDVLSIPADFSALSCPLPSAGLFSDAFPHFFASRTYTVPRGSPALFHLQRPFHDLFLPAAPNEPHTGKTDLPRPLHTVPSGSVPALYGPVQDLLPKAT